MGEVIASLSGEDQVVSGLPTGSIKIEQTIGPCGHPHGPTRQLVFSEDTVSLSDHFQCAVLDDPRYAWYVDYFTVDPWRYRVYFFSTEPLIRWTNENVSERDPFNVEESCWTPDDVAMWFVHENEDGTTTTYEHVIKFHSENAAHELRIGAYAVFLDGENRWDEYCEFGVRGAMGEFGEKRAFNRLDSIEVLRA